MTDTTAGNTVANGQITGFGTKGYRSYVLIALMLIYTLNFIDRTLISVVAQPIINSFSLTDTQWGLLSGPPFALFYALMGIPIAMWADRSNRVMVIAVCVILWSIMTALCGMATAFIWLLIFRVGVAIGEAGCTPPANSIITDYYPPKSRANAIGIYSMGVTLGGVLAQLFGGSIASIQGADFGAWIDSIGLGFLFSGMDWTTVEGWRIAFVVIGAPGAIIAIILWLTIKEPPRGYSDPPDADPTRKAPFFEAFKEFGVKPTFWWLGMGAALVAFVGYGLISFQAPFLQRVHGIDVREAAIMYGAPLAAFAAFGMAAGSRVAPRHPGLRSGVLQLVAYHCVRALGIRSGGALCLSRRAIFRRHRHCQPALARHDDRRPAPHHQPDRQRNRPALRWRDERFLHVARNRSRRLCRPGSVLRPQTVRRQDAGTRRSRPGPLQGVW